MKVQVNPRNQCLNNIVLQLLGKTKSFLHKYFIYCRTRIYTMIINTIHGQFDITQSLFEEIVRNNPEWILLEDDETTQKINYDVALKLMQDEPKKSGQAMGLVYKLLKDGGLTQDQFNQFKREKRKLEKSMAEKEKQKVNTPSTNIDDNSESNINNDENNDELQNTQNKQNMVNNVDNSLKVIRQIQEFNRDQELHKQIKEAERLALNIVKRVKILIQKYVGIGGSHVASTPSFNTYNATNNPTGANDDTQQTTDISLKAESVNNDLNSVLNEEESANDNQPNQTTEPTVNQTGVYSPSSDWQRRIKTGAQLALGGFSITPLFGTRDQAGKALKYYKSALRTSDTSKIDNMITLLFELNFKNDIKIADEYAEERKKFENMVYSFLHNVVYKLEVNNDKHYDNILRVIRGDPALRDIFDINFTYTKQQMNTEENVISYRNKTDKIVDLILVSQPIFYQGKKVMKTIGDALAQGRNLTA